MSIFIRENRRIKRTLQTQIQQSNLKFDKYKFNIATGQSKMITILTVPVENVIIQSIWFKTSLGDWVNVTAFDDIKCSITFEKIVYIFIA